MEEKLAKLKNILGRIDSALVAYSGGVDSTFLLKVVCDCLRKERVLAVTANSETYPSDELKLARRLADKFRVRHLIIETSELHNPKFSNNPVNRCYYCKRELFSRLKEIARDEKIEYVLDATQASDSFDFRPGDKAKKELGIRSPLKEAGFTKEDVRQLSKKFKLPTWDMPSKACLASRFPYGMRITRDGLRRVEKAEKIIRSLGFSQVRVRNYDSTAKIEVEKGKVPFLISKLRPENLAKIKKIGYKYITVDLEGYRTGSMNEGIKFEARNPKS
ncbi:MAG: ATP-dependent sacrificial sulfur transferase LarE [Candidatus Omnitrophica bacterium]|nr:ATP-dependent sacrificial sulfur transferase LarE [Candidatus Omnitrophota bacterium]MDD5609998.1 ATP-dependent sacrificial sulfur transferase LarE [Candidatus Omnitrophota bacterium]